MIYPNGLITKYGYPSTSLRTGYLNQLIFVETRNLIGALLASYAYTLNVKGQRTHVVEGAGGPVTRTIDYIYDDADRLVEERISDPVLGNRVITYTYDPVGNRLTKDDNGVITSYTYDDNDRLLIEGGYTYGYDNNGNLLSKVGNGEQYDFTYNALNQLVHADINTGGSSSTVEYVYDHDGIRVGKTINGTDIITYVVDKNRPYAQVLEEQWTNGALSATTGYMYGDALLSRTTNGTTQYYHYDGMGSVCGLTDSAGSLTDAYTYDAYGNLLDKIGSTINPYLYRGEQFDADLSSYYLRARYYQPGIGRFLTMDSEEGMLGDPLSAHRYLYGHNDPIHNLDPSGKSKLVDTMLTVGIISNLAAVSLTYVATVNADFGDSLAEILPDAGVIGISGSVSLKAIKTLKLLFGTVPLDADIIAMEAMKGWSGLDASVGVVFGGEILFSISSAQYGFYGFLGWQQERGNYTGKQWPVNVGFTISHGWVWNLWNTDDYVGPFYSINFGFGSHGGFSLFKDANRSFAEGPFGVSFSALAWSPRQGGMWSAGFSKTWYPRELDLPFVGKVKTYASHNEKSGMYEVAVKFTECELLMASLALGTKNSIGIVSSLGSILWPMTIATSKEVWNSRSHGGINASVYARQNTPIRPSGFRSRQRWIFWGGYDF